MQAKTKSSDMTYQKRGLNPLVNQKLEKKQIFSKPRHFRNLVKLVFSFKRSKSDIK